MSKKIYTVYYQPTGELWYFLDKKLAKKSEKALLHFARKYYKNTVNDANVQLEEHRIDTKVVFEP